jgi:predicted ATPase/signal transduction histidine kinase
MREMLYQGRGTAVYRAIRNADCRPVVLKVLDPRTCQAADLERLRAEFETERALDLGAIVKPIALETYDGMSALVLEDSGAEPLSRRLGVPMPVDTFLDLGARIASAVADVHRRGVIHKDLKPANILVHPRTSEVKIADFGLASRVEGEQAAAEGPARIEGSLPYMSPEQTGWLNRAVDSRSDLYALGAIFYEMLTGHTPFDAHDPLEWVHSQIARSPGPPHERVPGIPPLASAIVMKLLAKVAEDRYQTAAGLKHDLERSRAAWSARGSIEPFDLGERDASDRLSFPRKLYGRDREMAELQGAFDRVVESGAPAVVLVSGQSGVGKSSLVQELRRPIVRERGFFLSGKFEESRRDVPYATVIAAFRGLVSQILAEGEARIEEYKRELDDALGMMGGLIVDLIPQVELIIGAQTSAPALGTLEAEQRFRTVFQRFVGVFAKREHPVALFLDDMQWIDGASVKLLAHLLTSHDARFLLVLGAYRDNEVGPDHPLQSLLTALRRAETEVRTLLLGPLSRRDLAHFVADALHSERPRAEPLADVVFEKTSGNPFFATQFLTALYQEKLLEFDADTRSWRWDIPRIKAKEFTDNVVELMIGRMQQLTDAAQSALKMASLLGSECDLKTLAIISEQDIAATENDLREGVLEGLMLRRDDTYRFLHDRVRQAAYSLVPEERRAEVHLRIGRLLLGVPSAREIDDRLFDIVHHLNRGAELIDTQAERNRLAALNLTAGRRAKASAAYGSATRYLAAGSAQLAEDSWESEYELTFALYIERARCEWLSGGVELASELLGVVLEMARGPVDRSEAYRLKIELLATQARDEEGVVTALDAARELFGIELPLHPGEEDLRAAILSTKKALEARTFEDLRDHPAMTDPDARSAVALLASALPSVYLTDAKLLDLVCAFIVEMSIRYGPSQSSPCGYVVFGATLGRLFGWWDEAQSFARLARELVERPGLTQARADVYYVGAVLVESWTRPAHDVLPFLRESFRAAMEYGSLNYACIAAGMSIQCRLIMGDRLDDLAADAEQQYAFTRAAKFDLVRYIIVDLHRCIQDLRGVRPARPCSEGPGAEESGSECAAGQGGNAHAMRSLFHYTYAALAAVLLADGEAAVASVLEAKRFTGAGTGHTIWSEYVFITAMALALYYDQASPDERRRHREALTLHRERLRTWQEHCPATFHNRYALVSAEVHRIDGRDLEAMRAYEDAIASARTNHFVQNEALAYERAATFYAARGFGPIAGVYLREARSRYLLWGAEGKVKQLERLHPELVESSPACVPATFAAGAEQLDLSSVLKASQIISREIVLDRLIGTLLRVALVEGGGQKAYLVLCRGDQLSIEGEAVLDEHGVVTKMLQSETAQNASILPASILHYARLTKERVILGDATVDAGRFSSDPYVRAKGPKSVLCLPILKQDKVIGLLYLENDLVTRAFTRERLAALDILASQAAISIENALLLAREQRARVAEEQARSAAEAAERRSAFLVHELRTPLTTLRLKLDALARSVKRELPVGAALEAPFASMRRPIDRLTMMVDKLLDASRLRLGNLAPKRESVELISLVQGVMEMLGEQAEVAGCTFEIEAKEPVTGHWDRMSVEQVVTNLLINALKYGPHQPVRVVVDSDAKSARLAVTDRGIGIPEADQPRIFEPFERATDLHENQSLGMGLYIVREIVRAHGGEIRVHSQPGSGATFVVDLPLEGTRE